MKMKTLAAALLAAGGLVAGAAQANTQGLVAVSANAVSPGSTGVAEIRLQVPKMIQLQVLSDLRTVAASNELPGSDLVYDGTNPVTGNVDVCVWAKSNLAGDYTLTASGSGAGGAFTLANGADTVPYTLRIGATALTAGTGVARTTAAHNAGACAAATFSLTVDITAATIDANADLAGNFDGTLSLNVVTP